ncbi:hypothetical protein CC99x_002490 [Candidatus Berkiella cookevillensis]|uniref:Uncharacterized protein n=1 Tax=Candidatus Berkiella cookevillensis TaxID=437022 RepID=A0A0Q9YI04_9GAMM|nr:hypothetical protein [Candidatus Berkiella cookevillensis]MCS5707768.1 hypothetical protein [Candidatus Berkiella cookevillensis]
MLDFIKGVTCSTAGYNCPVVEEVCKSVYECYVAPYLTSIAAIAGGTALVAGGVAAYMNKDAILGKSEKAEGSEEISSVQNPETKAETTGPRRSARLASKYSK